MYCSKQSYEKLPSGLSRSPEHTKVITAYVITAYETHHSSDKAPICQQYQTNVIFAVSALYVKGPLKSHEHHHWRV